MKQILIFLAIGIQFFCGGPFISDLRRSLVAAIRGLIFYINPDRYSQSRLSPKAQISFNLLAYRLRYLSSIMYYFFNKNYS